MSPRKRKLQAENGETTTAKKSIIEHGQLGGLLDQTILTILSRATGPMPRKDIVEEVTATLSGHHIRHLGQLTSWASLARGSVINGAARKWYTETKLIPPEGLHGDDDRWTAYEITDLGRERHKFSNEPKEQKCVSKGIQEISSNELKEQKCIQESSTNQDSIDGESQVSAEKVLSTPELLSHIFSFLDYEDLQACRSVCRQWRAVVARHFFNENLGNSPRIVREAVCKNSATLDMKRIRFDCPEIKVGGGRVTDVQRDGDRTLVAVKHRKVVHLFSYKGRGQVNVKNLSPLGYKM